MPILEKGCGCCELVTCVKIQGFFLAVVLSVIAILDVLFLALWIPLRELDPGPSAEEFDRRVFSTTKVVCAGMFVCIIVWVLIVCLMLYGVYRRRRVLFWPYMVIASVNLFATAGILIFYASSVNSQVLNMIVLTFILVFQFYLLLHVVSLFQKMGDERIELSSHEQQT